MFRDLMFLLTAAACLAAVIASPADSKPHKDNTTDIVTWPQLENELLIKQRFYKEYFTKMLELIEVIGHLPSCTLSFTGIQII